MAEQDQNYKGLQSAIQVYQEFSGSKENIQTEIQNEEQVEAKPIRVQKLSEEQNPSSSSHFKRQSSWKRFKESVKETLSGWKGGGHDHDESNTITEEGETNKGREIPIEDLRTQPEVPQRSKSVRINRQTGDSSKANFRSSMRESRDTTSGLVPKIVVTNDDGKLATPSPKLTPKSKRESFCSSLPDVTCTASEVVNKESEGKKMQNIELTHKQIRQAIIDAARQKTRQRAVRFESEGENGSHSENTVDTRGTTVTTVSSMSTYQSTSIRSSVLKQNFTRETLSMSNPDVSLDSHESAKLAVMKIRAAIANMSVDPVLPLPVLNAENPIVRRRLSSDEAQSVNLKPSEEQLNQRSSSVDFLIFPVPRKEILRAANQNPDEKKTENSPSRSNSIKRAESLKRTESMKRTESTKRKKARPMIWDHFDDVPHTSLQGRCKVCHMIVSCKFNTGHFVRHLQLAHRDVYLSYQNKMQSNWTRSQLERSLK